MSLTITSSVLLPRPAEEVVGFVLDWGNDVRWRAGVRDFVVTPPGPAHVGQELVEELGFAGLTFRTPTRVTAAEGGVVRYRGGSRTMTVDGERRVLDLGAAASRVETVTRLTPRGVMRVVAPVLAPAYRRADARDLTRLAELLTRADAPS